MKTSVLTLAALFISAAALGQDEWNTTNNSTAAMYRDGNVAIGTGAVNTLPFVVMNPNAGVGTKVAFGATGMQGGYGAGDAVFEVTGQSNANGTYFGINTIGNTTRSSLQFGVSTMWGAGIYSVRGSGGTTQPLGFWTQGSAGMTEKMRIEVDGKIRIGSLTSGTPGTYKLYVEDGILTEKVKVAVDGTVNWSDYVFAPDYKLKPIEEVAAFVKKNKHLPGVPSAEEMVKEGLDVATMDAKLLEKIEEMMLYIIELKGEVEQLKKENNTLQSSK